jgi:carbamoyltransferase
LIDCYLGDDIKDHDAADAVAGTGLRVERPTDIHLAVAQLLADGSIVARCAGRMEYGARALGNRSILANPADPDVTRRLNRLVKQRDFWMPFAPAVLDSQQSRYIINPKRLASQFMMLGFDSVPGATDHMIAALHPADLSCRPQIVRDHDGSGIAAILSAYLKLTGNGVLLNTSLNLHGDPIARTAGDAVKVLLNSNLQHIQIGDLLISK